MALGVSSLLTSAINTAQPLPYQNPSLWDYLVIDSGPVTIRLACTYGGNRTTQVDSALIIAGAGGDQYNLRRNPSKFSFTIKVWTPQQMQDYESALRLAMSAGNALRTFSVFHPALHQLDVHQVYLEGVSPLAPVKPGGHLEAKWNLTERLGAQFLAPQGPTKIDVKGAPVTNEPPSVTEAGKTS